MRKRSQKRLPTQSMRWALPAHVRRGQTWRTKEMSELLRAAGAAHVGASGDDSAERRGGRRRGQHLLASSQRSMIFLSQQVGGGGGGGGGGSDVLRPWFNGYRYFVQMANAFGWAAAAAVAVVVVVVVG